MLISPPPADVPSSGSAADMTPVERFVREVLPTVPGGPQQVTVPTGHSNLIQRAAANRGLSAKTFGGTIYFYDGRLPVGGLRGMTTNLIGSHALAICKSKDLTKQMLGAAGVPTPVGITLDSGQFDEALAHVRASGPLVLKPSEGARGEGVTCGIATEEDLRAAWGRAELAAGKEPLFVLEEQIEGIDIRAFVVGRRVAAAATRLPAYVVGDGRRSIAELIELKQQQREKNVYLAKMPLIVDPALLARGGRALPDVPVAGEVVVLNGAANLHAGGENVDVTELVHPDLLSLAVDAARAIPGLGVAGVDLMTPDLGSADGAVVLETNGPANIRVHHCPAYGRPQDVAGAIVDEMIATAGAPPRSTSRTTSRRAGIARRMARAARRRLSAESR